jgi:UDP-2,3-diacylglucosamine hydrolase
VSGGEIAFVGDVHLDADDPELDAFCRFLERLGQRVSRIVLLGDLFNLWIGDRRLEQPPYAGLAFDDVATAGLVERQGAQTLFAIHGDLTNPHDRRYRAWRRISRTPAAWLVLAALPPRRRLRLAERLEARMRRTNTAFKRELPEPELSAYARRWLDRGHDAVVLGHFHVERDIALERGRLVVLPDWKAGRRWLHVDAAGRLAFAGPETS